MLRTRKALWPALSVLFACSGAERITLFIGPEWVDCVGVGPRQCMQARESRGEPWQNFFDAIEGFDYEPGFEYELVVERHTVENPPADGSSLRYVLVRIVSKTPVGSP